MARRAFVLAPTLWRLTRRLVVRVPCLRPSRAPSQLGLRPSSPPPSILPPLRPSVPSGRPARALFRTPGGPSRPSSRVCPARMARCRSRRARSCWTAWRRPTKLPFIATWIEGVLSGRMRTRPDARGATASRLSRDGPGGPRARPRGLSAQRTGIVEPARRAARLAIERAILATIDGRGDHAGGRAASLASRAPSDAAPKGTWGLREQLDLHLTQAQLELRSSIAPANASNALRLAEHVVERLEEGRRVAGARWR